jgi:hypothetical protein
MVMLDALTNRSDILAAWVAQAWLKPLHQGLCLAEDSCKLLAESCFLTGFHQALRTARRADP